MHPKVGDLVQLKSGGPIMTVFEDNGYGILQVTFFHQDGEIRRLSFSPAVLNTVNASSVIGSVGNSVALPGLSGTRHDSGGAGQAGSGAGGIAHVTGGVAGNNGLGGGQGG